MDEEQSENESVPPAANGHAVPAAAAAAANGNPVPAAPQHPLWERAAGRGGGGGRGGGAKNPNPGQTTSQGRFCPISMAALEQRARNEFDGASSVGARTAHARSRGDRPRRARDEDDDAEEERGFPESRHAKKKKRQGNVHDYDDLEQEDDNDEQSDAGSGADVVAGAAFGGGGDGARNTCHTLSIASDTDDGVSSVTSSRAREAHRRAFPISGETCVGCALPAKVGPVDDFVRTHCDKMKEDALFKMAALVYHQKVVEPAEAEEVPVPSWAWKDIRAHYTMHRMDPKMQRYENMRTLAAMRKTIELSLQKEEQDDDGNRVYTLDKANAEQIMKVITLQSREITLLHETGSSGGAKGATAKKP